MAASMANFSMPPEHAKSLAKLEAERIVLKFQDSNGSGTSATKSKVSAEELRKHTMDEKRRRREEKCVQAAIMLRLIEADFQLPMRSTGEERRVWKLDELMRVILKHLQITHEGNEQLKAGLGIEVPDDVLVTGLPGSLASNPSNQAPAKHPFLGGPPQPQYTYDSLPGRTYANLAGPSALDGPILAPRRMHNSFGQDWDDLDDFDSSLPALEQGLRTPSEGSSPEVQPTIGRRVWKPLHNPFANGYGNADPVYPDPFAPGPSQYIGTAFDPFVMSGALPVNAPDDNANHLNATNGGEAAAQNNLLSFDFNLDFDSMADDFQDPPMQDNEMFKDFDFTLYDADIAGPFEPMQAHANDNDEAISDESFQPPIDSGDTPDGMSGRNVSSDNNFDLASSVDPQLLNAFDHNLSADLLNRPVGDDWDLFEDTDFILSQALGSVD